MHDLNLIPIQVSEYRNARLFYDTRVVSIEPLKKVLCGYPSISEKLRISRYSETVETTSRSRPAHVLGFRAQPLSHIDLIIILCCEKCTIVLTT